MLNIRFLLDSASADIMLLLAEQTVVVMRSELHFQVRTSLFKGLIELK